MGDPSGPIHFLNIEYFFRLLYESRASFIGDLPDSPIDAFTEWVIDSWTILGFVSFIFSLAAFAILVYCSARLYQLRQQEEHELYSTLEPEVAEKAKDHSRWAHIQGLIESAQESDWRQALIEADIMLDEVLTQAGYIGATVGDKLKGARFNTIEDAWEAHKIRNEIAHQGSSYKLDDNIAYRTVKRYERVFKEFGEI